MSFGVDWNRRMINELWNSTCDSSEGGLGWCESACLSNAPGRDAGGGDSDNEDDEEDPDENHEEETNMTETQSSV